jgi:hypothetical protein
MSAITPETLAKEIKSAVEWLKEKDCGCVTLKLNGTLAVCVGWSDGFDPDDEYQSKCDWCEETGFCTLNEIL